MYKFANMDELETFIFTLCSVLPEHETMPTVLSITNLRNLTSARFPTGPGDTPVALWTPRGKVKLVDKELYSFEEKYQDRLSRLEKMLEGES